MDTRTDGATLLVKDADATPDQAVLHELLHLHRYWIDGVPQLIGVDPPMNGVIAPRENSLEHLIIVPKQADWGLRDEEYWNSGAREEWRDHTWPTNPTAILRKALLGWLRTHIVTDDSVIELARMKLTALNLTQEAEAFKAQAVELLSDKVRLAAFAIHSWQMDPRRVRLFYFNDGGKTAPLPTWPTVVSPS